MTATAKSGHATNHVRNGYRVYEILVDIGEESTIDEIVREFAIRHEGEILNRNTARARKSEFKKDMKEVEIMNSEYEAYIIRQDEQARKQRLEERLRKLLMLFVGMALVGLVIVKLCA